MWCQTISTRFSQLDWWKWISWQFIQEAQLNARNHEEVLEWVSYNKLKNVEHLDKRGSGTVYKAIWLDTPIRKWSIDERKWDSKDQMVALKSLSNLNKESLNKILNWCFY